MTVTPLCHRLARLSLSPDNEACSRRYSARGAKRVRRNSPEIFSSALRPLFPDRSQSTVIRARACPARTRRETDFLRIRPFRLAPKNPPTGPVEFVDIKRPSHANITLRSERKVIKPRILTQDPTFFYALVKRQLKKRHLPRFLRTPSRRPSVDNNIKQRVAHNTTPPTNPPDRLVPKPSIPFNDETDLDPFMLFPEKQWPFSALKEDSRRYREEREAALEAKAQRWLRVRPGGEMMVEDWKDIIQSTYGLGRYALPSRHSFVEEVAGSPMDVGW